MRKKGQEVKEKRSWIIGIGGSNMDDVITYRVYGSEEAVKAHLVARVIADKEEAEEEGCDAWSYGTEEVEDVTKAMGTHLYAYGCYENSHKDYTATLEKDPMVLEDVPIDREFEIEGITLLSVEEVEKLPEEMLSCEDGWWWLRSPGDVSDDAASVYVVGSVGYFGYSVSYGFGYVRPALMISNLKSSDLKIGDKVEVLGHTWTVISEDMALCDRSIGHCAFRKDWEAEDANDYEKSDVKKYLEDWLKERLEEQAS